MGKKVFLAVILACALFASCNKKTTEEEKLPEGVQHFEADTSVYGSWLCIDLKKGTTVIQKELGEREYRRYLMEGNGEMKTDKDGNWLYEVEKTVKATGSEKDWPKEWDIAFHKYDPKINDGSCLMTEETDISAIKTFPEGDYKTDSQGGIYVDMERMKTDAVLGIAKPNVNKEMKKWLKSTGMGKPKIMSDKVFAVKFSNGKRVLIKFKDFKDDKGKKGRISFDYKFFTE